MHKTSFKIALIVLVTAICRLAGAQSAIPFKVDGRADDWKAVPKLFNKNNRASYAIMNDSDNLYLLLSTKDVHTASKIVMGGITFTLTGKGKEKQWPAFTFPAYERSEELRYLRFQGKPANTADSARCDSFARVINTRLDGWLKSIGLNHVLSAGDSLISVFNDLGIRAMARMDAHLNFNVEMCISLKYINTGGSNKLTYNIRLNGITAVSDRTELSASGRFLLFYRGNGQRLAMPMTPEFADMAYATDFNGEYMLIR